MLIVMSSFYSFKMKLDNWMVNKNGLALDENDARVITLTNFFKSVQDDLKAFIEKGALNHTIDNW